MFDLEDTSSDATTPQFTISNLVGTFQRGEKITVGVLVLLQELYLLHSITYVLTQMVQRTLLRVKLSQS